ncbi:Transposase family Tnp2 protein [Mycena venus]|uniref:Transposase family Tnp2 protein n=1 Tax=Mycena venus TaxID=2733690 RepID=A0A8H6Z430_9AGAR|nr:Transposase family Tnp2 protein [Mycena venus]
MKGHNSQCPCRMCSIVGIQAPNKRLYVPLSRPAGTQPYDPLNLPLRDHKTIMAQATLVSKATNDAEEKERAQKYGIKGEYKGMDEGSDIDTIERGMASWVQEFERLYYQYKLDRLPVCTLPIHGLLHIAGSIRVMGLSWCYWAYPMERFCGSLLPAIKSRRFPWASIDRRILELAQLFQIKAIYSLSKTLDLRRRRKIEVSGTTLAAYPRCVLVYPREMRPVSANLREKISKHLASCYNATREQIVPLIASHLEHWGKIQWLEGGDMMHASELGKHGTQDMTHVKFNGHYGQLRLLLVVKLEPSEVLQTTTTKFHLLAVVARSILTLKNRLDML